MKTDRPARRNRNGSGDVLTAIGAGTNANLVVRTVWEQHRSVGQNRTCVELSPVSFHRRHRGFKECPTTIPRIENPELRAVPSATVVAVNVNTATIRPVAVIHEHIFIVDG